MAIYVPLICHSGKAKYFLFWGLTRFPKIGTDLPVGLRFVCARIARDIRVLLRLTRSRMHSCGSGCRPLRKSADKPLHSQIQIFSRLIFFRPPHRILIMKSAVVGADHRQLELLWAISGRGNIEHKRNWERHFIILKRERLKDLLHPSAVLFRDFIERKEQQFLRNGWTSNDFGRSCCTSSPRSVALQAPSAAVDISVTTDEIAKASSAVRETNGLSFTRSSCDRIDAIYIVARLHAR